MSNVHGMIRSAYKFNPDVVSNETALDTGEDAVTQQCFKDECDINILLAKFALSDCLFQRSVLLLLVQYNHRYCLPCCLSSDIER